MKNVMFTVVLALGSLTTFAFSTNEIKSAVTESVLLQDGFSEISASDLPAEVSGALAKNYPTAKINKVSVNKSKQYKLEVSLEDGTAGTLYADEKGNWIEL